MTSILFGRPWWTTWPKVNLLRQKKAELCKDRDKVNGLHCCLFFDLSRYFVLSQLGIESFWF